MQIRGIAFPCGDLLMVLYSLDEYISNFLDSQGGLI